MCQNKDRIIRRLKMCLQNELHRFLADKVLINKKSVFMTNFFAGNASNIIYSMQPSFGGKCGCKIWQILLTEIKQHFYGGKIASGQIAASLGGTFVHRIYRKFLLSAWLNQPKLDNDGIQKFRMLG